MKVSQPLCTSRKQGLTLEEHYAGWIVTWSPATQVVMGNPNQFSLGAVLRIHGALRPEGDLEAALIAVLTHVASIQAEQAT